MFEKYLILEIDMRITQEADYALRIMSLLSYNNKILDAGSIASGASVPPRFALKILRKLVQGGLVRSQKGVAGGYIASDRAENATLREVIELIDGPLAISKCVDGNCGCSLLENKSECAIHHIFQIISDEITEKLDRVTISEVAAADENIADLIKKIKQ